MKYQLRSESRKKNWFGSVFSEFFLSGKMNGIPALPVFNKFLLLLTLIGCGSSGADLSRPIPLRPYDRTDRSLEITHLKGGVYLVEDNNFLKTNSLIYIDSGGAWFINATYLPKTAHRVYWKAESSTLEDFHGLILTGPELHFTGGASLFSGRRVPVIMHAAGKARYLLEFDSMNEQMRNLFTSWNGAAPVKPEAAVFRTDPFTGLSQSELVQDSILLVDPETENSSGQILVYFPKEKILYGGDIISFPSVSGDGYPGCSWCTVAERISPHFVISGHGEPLIPFRKISEYCGSCSVRQKVSQ